MYVRVVTPVHLSLNVKGVKVEAPHLDVQDIVTKKVIKWLINLTYL